MRARSTMAVNPYASSHPTYHRQGTHSDEHSPYPSPAIFAARRASISHDSLFSTELSLFNNESPGTMDRAFHLRPSNTRMRSGSSGQWVFKSGAPPVLALRELLKFNPSELRPWIAPKNSHGEYLQRNRSWVERIHISLTCPEVAKLATWYITWMVLIIVASSVLLVVSTLPGLQAYTPECEPCRPLSDQTSRDEAAIMNRSLIADYCRGCAPSLPAYFESWDIIFNLIFTADYLVRLVTAHAVPLPSESRRLGMGPISQRVMKSLTTKLKRTLSWIVQPLNAIDLIALLPFYLQFASDAFTAESVAFLRILRLCRLGRMGKLARYREVMILFASVTKASLLAFAIFTVLTVVGMVMLAAAVFYAERGEWDPVSGRYMRDSLYYLDPEETSPFTSIPISFWWVLVTFTSVGYGDMVPTTWAGQLIGTLTMYSGVLLLTIPITIVGVNFADVYYEHRARRERSRRVREYAAKGLHGIIGSDRVVPMRRAFRAWVERVRSRDPPPDLQLLIRSELKRFRLRAQMDARKARALRQEGGTPGQDASKSRPFVRRRRASDSSLTSVRESCLSPPLSVTHGTKPVHFGAPGQIEDTNTCEAEAAGESASDGSRDGIQCLQEEVRQLRRELQAVLSLVRETGGGSLPQSSRHHHPGEVFGTSDLEVSPAVTPSPLAVTPSSYELLPVSGQLTASRDQSREEEGGSVRRDGKGRSSAGSEGSTTLS